jgi:hypothetical protein
MKPQIKEYNCETGIETIRDATDAEIAEIQNRELEEANRKAEAQAKAQAKAALLSRLGITADEAKLLLEGN